MEDILVVLNLCSDKAELSGVQSLTPEERVVHLANTVDFEVCLGGLTGFYTNSAGDHALETVSALETIGASDAAKSVRDSFALFSDVDFLTDSERWQDRTMSVDMQLRSLESLFESQDPSVEELVEAYIRDRWGS